MKKIQIIDTCDCINKLLIVGYLREYNSEETISNYYIGEIIDGQICMKMDIIVDNGNYNEDGIYNTDFEITSSYYPIQHCPICGKKIEYIKLNNKSLNLVWQTNIKRVYYNHKRRPRGVV